MRDINIKRIWSLMSKRKRNISRSSESKIFKLRLFHAPFYVTVGEKRRRTQVRTIASVFVISIKAILLKLKHLALPQPAIRK